MQASDLQFLNGELLDSIVVMLTIGAKVCMPKSTQALPLS